MNFTHFTAGTDDSGRRLDKIIRRFLSDETLSSLYKSLRKGLIKVNGKKCDGNFRINEGDTISIANFLLGNASDSESISSKTPQNLTEKASPLSNETIVFRNEAILIINKPYDIPVQPSSSSNKNSLSEIVQKDYEITHEKSSLSFRTGPLHRLDRKTTGLIAFSQNLEGAKWFSEKIKTHEIQKVYLAILEGKLAKNEIWEDYIQKMESGKSGGDSFHTVSIGDSEDDGKFAHTEVLPVSHAVFNGKEITLARILITTGRTHQIRSQASYHGFPLLGDTAYGGMKIDSKRFGQEFFLHAYELHFPKDNPLGLPEKITAPANKFYEKIFPQIQHDSFFH